MNNQNTIEKLRTMRLGAMAQMHNQYVTNQSFNELTPDEYLAMLTDYEYEERLNKKINRLIKGARFNQQASLNEIDYKQSRNLEKTCSKDSQL